MGVEKVLHNKSYKCGYVAGSLVQFKQNRSSLHHKKNNKLDCQKLDSFMSMHENCGVQVKVARTTASVSEACNSLIRYMA